MKARIKIGGIRQNSQLSMVGVLAVPDRPGVAATVLDALGGRGINVQFIISCIDNAGLDHVVLCVDRHDFAAAREELQDRIQGATGGRLLERPHVAMIAIFGPDFKDRPGIAVEMFRALAGAGINILAISTSISTIACVIEAHQLPAAVTLMQNTFELP